MNRKESIGYLIGVVLGDGCIFVSTKNPKHHMYQLSITSEDIDICQKCKDILYNYFLLKSEIKEVFVRKKLSYYQLVCCSKYICRYLNILTKKKTRVPFIKDISVNKELLCGLMDSDGWISKVNASDGYTRYRIGFKNTNINLVNFVYKMCNDLNIVTGEIRRRNNKRYGIINKDFYEISINTKSYSSKMFFRIKRKEDLLKSYKNGGI